jgi:hypothetical protein
MATANDIVSRALRLLGVIASGETIEASTGADALAVLNALLAEMHEAGIGLPDYSFTGLTDTLASDAADQEALAYQLAIRIAPEYGLSLSPEAAAIARVSMFRLRSRYLAVSHPVASTYY